MRTVFPIIFVILGIGVANYANGRIPGGLADADLEELVQLAREGAIDSLDWAFPEWRDTRDRRSVHRRSHGHSQRMRHSSHDTRSRVRFRVQERENPIEITFVVPVEKKEDAKSHRRR